MKTADRVFRRQLFSIPILVAVACILGAALAVVLSEHKSAIAQSTQNQYIFLPLIGDAEQDIAQNTSDASVHNDTVKRYVNQQGGYTFQFPADWEIVEHEGTRAYVTVSPSTESSIGSIHIEYLSYEIPESESLLEWAPEYYKIMGSGPQLVYTPVSLSVEAANGLSSQVFFLQQSRRDEPKTLGQGYLISHGRLVLMIYVETDKDEPLGYLEDLANSVTFVSGAPLDLIPVYAPSSPPLIRTVEAWKQNREEWDIALHALTLRKTTGETPTGLLESAPARSQMLYEQMLVEDEEEIAELDAWRELQENPPVPEGWEAPTRYTQEEFEEAEREYNESLEESQEQLEQESTPESEFDIEVNAAIDLDIAGRRGIAANYKSPIRVYPRYLNCGSDYHELKETYAVDISISNRTPVYATGAMTVEATASGWNWGYGTYVRTSSREYSGQEDHTYYHMFAHLDESHVTAQQVLGSSDQIGLSGCTGNCDPEENEHHLHYSIWTADEHPVDLSPVKGLTPDLHYPDEYAYCGFIRDPDDEPVIIEVNEFDQNYNPGTHEWGYSTYYSTKHTGTAYRALVPISPEWSYAPLDDMAWFQTPSMQYNVWLPTTTNYYVWVCGMGGNSDNDSVHMSANGVSASSPARDIRGWHDTDWVWASVRMDETRPYLPINRGYNWINMFGRENEMRVDRILLTKDQYYNPQGNIRCAGEGLPFP